MDEALARLEREVAQDPSDEARLRALAAAKQRAGWTYAGRGFEHWVTQLSVADLDARDHRTEEAFRSFGIAAVPALLDATASGAAEGAIAAIRALGPRAVLVAVPVLRHLASSANGELRRGALSLLLSQHTSLDDMFDLFEREVVAPDEDARLDALKYLALHDPMPPSAIPHVVRALRDPEALVRRHAARLLSRVVDPRVRQEDVVEALLSQDVSGARAPGEPTFETVAGRDAIPAFLAATGSSEARVRARAIRLLAVQQHGDHREAVASAVRRALTDDDGDVRSEAAEALQHMTRSGLDPMFAANAVLAMVGDPSNDRRAEAAWLLGSVGSATVALPALTHALRDRDPDVRRAAMTALAARGAAARPALPSLLALRRDEDLIVRRMAAATIAGIGVDEDQLPLVEELLRADESRELGAWILAAAGAAGASLAPTVLGLLADERREPARRALADALLAMGRALDVALPARIPDGLPYGHVGESFELGERLASTSANDPSIVPALTLLLDHPSDTTRVMAAHALAAAGTGDGPLLDLLAGAPNPHDRARAAGALGALGRSTAPVLAALAVALEEPDARVGVAAADAIGSFGAAGSPAAQVLERAVASEHADLSRAARHALDAVLRELSSTSARRESRPSGRSFPATDRGG